MHACNGSWTSSSPIARTAPCWRSRVRDIADEGKNLVSPTQHNLIKLGNIANGYRIGAIRYEPYAVLTNKCPSGANRGIGKPFMCFAIERAMALLARRLGWTRPSSACGTTSSPTRCRTRRRPALATTAATIRPRCSRALERFDYAGLARRAGARPGGRAAARDRHRHVGGAGRHQSRVLRAGDRPPRCLRLGRSRDGPRGARRHRARGRSAIRPAARATRRSSPRSSPTSWASPPARVQVERGFDSATTPWLYLSGNYANKFSVTDVGAMVGAARAVRESC